MKKMLPIEKWRDAKGHSVKDNSAKVSGAKGSDPSSETSETSENAVFNPEWIPYELDIFYRSFESFLPEGKTFDDLTEKEKKSVQDQYRFSPLRPGIYQGITGITDRNGNIGF